MLLRKRVYIFGVFSALLFLILTIYCMSVYPGGIVTDHYSVGYDFFKNYFSDLGRTHDFLGRSNFASMAIFMTLVTLIGLATIFYYITTPYFFSNILLCRKLSVYGSVMGFITGLGYIGIAFTPADLLLPLHLVFVQIAFNSFFVAVILYSIAIYKNPVYPDFYAYVYLMYALVLGCYILIMLFGPSGRTPEGIGIQASSQKMVVYSQILCMMIQAYGSWMLNNKIAKEGSKVVE